MRLHATAMVANATATATVLVVGASASCCCSWPASDTASEALRNGDFSTMLSALRLSRLGKEIEDRAVTLCPLPPTRPSRSSRARSSPTC